MQTEMTDASFREQLKIHSLLIFTQNIYIV